MQIAISASPAQDSLDDIYSEFPKLANLDGFASLS